MPTITPSIPYTWKSFTDGTVDTYVGEDREPFLDRRNGGLKLRISDGVTPGGRSNFLSPIGAIQTPSILAPIDNGVNIVRDPIITASPFTGLDVNGSALVHSGSYWALSLNSDLTSPILEVALDVDNLNTLDLSRFMLTLLPDTKYYVAVRYVSDKGFSSNFSDTIEFTTRDVMASAYTGNIEFAANLEATTQVRPLAWDLSGDGKHAVSVSKRSATVFKATIWSEVNGVWSVSSTILDFSTDVYRAKINRNGTIVSFTHYLEARATIYEYNGSDWLKTLDVTLPAPATNLTHAELDVEGEVCVLRGYGGVGTSGFIVPYTRESGGWIEMDMDAPTLNAVGPNGQTYGSRLSILSYGLTMAVYSNAESLLYKFNYDKATYRWVIANQGDTTGHNVQTITSIGTYVAALTVAGLILLFDTSMNLLSTYDLNLTGSVGANSRIKANLNHDILFVYTGSGAVRALTRSGNTLTQIGTLAQGELIGMSENADVVIIRKEIPQGVDTFVYAEVYS